MSTTIRAELSGKNEYWICRHRYYELKHFCLQYPEWKQNYNSLDGMSRQGKTLKTGKTNSDPTLKCVELRAVYKQRMELIEKVAQMTDPVLGSYILVGVTSGQSYDRLRARIEIPCCKEIYYDLYRRFFWLLDKERQ